VDHTLDASNDSRWCLTSELLQNKLEDYETIRRYSTLVTSEELSDFEVDHDSDGEYKPSVKKRKNEGSTKRNVKKRKVDIETDSLENGKT